MECLYIYSCLNVYTSLALIRRAATKLRARVATAAHRRLFPFRQKARGLIAAEEQARAFSVKKKKADVRLKLECNSSFFLLPKEAQKVLNQSRARHAVMRFKTCNIPLISEEF